MILFYNKNTGKIFATVYGRVHTTKDIENVIYDNNENSKEDVKSFVIGWESTDNIEEIEVEEEQLIDMGNDIFKKVKRKVKEERTINIEHNMDQFKLLQKFEDNGPEKPLKYKIKDNKLIP